jgi:hypothetical protein
MAHMPTYGEDGSGCAQSGSCTGPRVVTYTATGAEGTDFFVPIGATLAADDYEMWWAPAGVTALPIIDLPTGSATDRKTTEFRVLAGDAITAGAVIKFFIQEQ